MQAAVIVPAAVAAGAAWLFSGRGDRRNPGGEEVTRMRALLKQMDAKLAEQVAQMAYASGQVAEATEAQSSAVDAAAAASKAQADAVAASESATTQWRRAVAQGRVVAEQWQRAEDKNKTLAAQLDAAQKEAERLKQAADAAEASAKASASRAKESEAQAMRARAAQADALAAAQGARMATASALACVEDADEAVKKAQEDMQYWEQLYTRAQADAQEALRCMEQATSELFEELGPVLEQANINKAEALRGLQAASQVLADAGDSMREALAQGEATVRQAGEAKSKMEAAAGASDEMVALHQTSLQETTTAVHEAARAELASEANLRAAREALECAEAAEAQATRLGDRVDAYADTFDELGDIIECLGEATAQASGDAGRASQLTVEAQVRSEAAEQASREALERQQAAQRRAEAALDSLQDFKLTSAQMLLKPVTGAWSSPFGSRDAALGLPAMPKGALISGDGMRRPLEATLAMQGRAQALTLNNGQGGLLPRTLEVYAKSAPRSRWYTLGPFGPAGGRVNFPLTKEENRAGGMQVGELNVRVSSFHGVPAAALWKDVLGIKIVAPRPSSGYGEPVLGHYLDGYTTGNADPSSPIQVYGANLEPIYRGAEGVKYWDDGVNTGNGNAPVRGMGLADGRDDIANEKGLGCVRMLFTAGDSQELSDAMEIAKEIAPGATQRNLESSVRAALAEATPAQLQDAAAKVKAEWPAATVPVSAEGIAAALAAEIAALQTGVKHPDYPKRLVPKNISCLSLRAPKASGGMQTRGYIHPTMRKYTSDRGDGINRNAVQCDSGKVTVRSVYKYEGATHTSQTLPRGCWRNGSGSLYVSDGKSMRTLYRMARMKVYLIKQDGDVEVTAEHMPFELLNRSGRSQQAPRGGAPFPAAPRSNGVYSWCSAAMEAHLRASAVPCELELSTWRVCTMPPDQELARRVRGASDMAVGCV